MTGACDAIAAEVGSGVGAALRAVDCVASETTATAFGRLFAPGGALTGALTILLTLFVATFAISLLLGRSSLGVRSLTPRMITLGLVLTFATSWIAYQSVVWNLAIGAPDQLASILMGSDGSATRTFADKIDIVFLALQETTQGTQDFSAFTPPGMMWLGGMLLLLGTVGVLVTARIALAVLVAIGPVFVVLALFGATRGLFAGWLKGLVMLAVTPVFVVLGGSVMLELAVPIIQTLTATPGVIDPQAAMAFFLVGAVHVALMALVMKVAATMVGGWSVFGIAGQAERDDRRAFAAPLAAPSLPAVQPLPRTAPALPAAQATSRMAVPGAANDPGLAATTRRAVVVGPQVATAKGTDGAGMAARPRAQGIGSRFRPAHSPRTEKFR